MYLVAACLLTLRPLLGKISIKELGARFSNRKNTQESIDSRGKIRSRPRPSNLGFIELQDQKCNHSLNGIKLSSNLSSKGLKGDIEQGLASATTNPDVSN